jgi:hypothetical protein
MRMSNQIRYNPKDTSLANRVDPLQGSNLLGFILDVEGSVGRSISDRLSEYCSVKDFGAVGDGVADDTQAFLAAIDAAQVLGSGGVFIPDGNYVITQHLFLKECGAFVGSELGRVTLWMHNDSSIVIGRANSTYHGTRVANLRLQSMAPQSGPFTGVGIVVGSDPQNYSGTFQDAERYCRNTVIDRCVVSRFDVGIKFDGHAFATKINECWVYFCNTGVYYDQDGEDRDGDGSLDLSDSGGNNFIFSSYVSQNVNYGVRIDGIPKDGCWMKFYALDSEHNGTDYYFKKVAGTEMYVALFGCHSELPTTCCMRNEGAVVGLHDCTFLQTTANGTAISPRKCIIQNTGRLMIYGGRFMGLAYVDIVDNTDGTVYCQWPAMSGQTGWRKIVSNNDRYIDWAHDNNGTPPIYGPGYGRQRFSNVAPTDSTSTGTICWNTEPASGEYVGWIYTAAGWKEFGIIS